MNFILRCYYHITRIMNTLELFDDLKEMSKISKFAEENELTVDYCIEEFVIDNVLVEP